MEVSHANSPLRETSPKMGEARFRSGRAERCLFSPLFSGSSPDGSSQVICPRRKLLALLARAAGAVAVTVALPATAVLRRRRRAAAPSLGRAAPERPWLPRIVPLSDEDIGPAGDLAG